MNNPVYGSGTRSGVRLWRGRGSHERPVIDAILDEALWATIAYTIDGQPFATPTQVWRQEDWIYWHGSAGSRMLQTVQTGPEVCVSAYMVDGLVLSRLASAHSINYRSVMAFGRPEPVLDDAEKLAQMRHYFERLFPGRWKEVVEPTLRDMRRIIMVRMKIDEAVAKSRKGPPGDGEALFAQAAWAGVLPIARATAEPIPAPRLKAGLATPAYLQDFGIRRAFRQIGVEDEEPPTRIAAEIVGIENLTPEIRCFHIRPLAEKHRYPAEPGAHIRIEVVRDDGTLDWRSYSVVNAGTESDTYAIAVRRSEIGTGGSRHLHTRFAKGSIVTIQPPASDFALPGDVRQATLIAGGIGITPIPPMARALRQKGVPFSLHYGGRARESMAFLAEAADLAGEQFVVHVSEGDPARRMSPEVVIPAYEAGHHIAVCGPVAMLEAVIMAAREKGYPAEAVHFELFAAPGASAHPNAAVRVHLARSGLSLDVPANMPILSAILDAGIEVPHSCRRGECRQCACKVLAGEPNHRDLALSASERSEGALMCICVSRALTPELTLDL